MLISEFKSIINFHTAKRLFPLCVVVLCLLASSCKTSKRTFYADDIYGPQKHHNTTQINRPDGNSNGNHYIPASEQANNVIKAAEKWLGTPYRFGGNSSDGTDCSGLTTMAYLNGAGISLPRTSSEQSTMGKEVDHDHIRPGDLAFFTNKNGGNGRINHVAIYIGNGRILHATTSKGVCYSQLSEPYWSTHLYCFRRILPDND